MTFPHATLIRIDDQLTLRVTHEGAIKAEFPISIPNAALLTAEGALFVRDQICKLPTTKLNQPKE